MPLIMNFQINPFFSYDWDFYMEMDLGTCIYLCFMDIRSELKTTNSIVKFKSRLKAFPHNPIFIFKILVDPLPILLKYYQRKQAYLC